MSIDINQIIIWDKFKTKFLSSLDDVEPFEVDLSFEDKHPTTGIVNTYSSGDELFFCDIKLNSDFIPLLEIPFGANSRFLKPEYFDLISNKTLGFLDFHIEKCYTPIYDELPDKNKIAENLYSFCATLAEKEKDKTKILNILNNSSEYLRKNAQEEKDKKSLQKISDLGLF